MVMPRSRSMSIRSRYCARALRSSTTPVSCSIRSASVDLPWSMWAMMQKLRMSRGSVWPGAVWDTEDSRARGELQAPKAVGRAVTGFPRPHRGADPIPSTAWVKPWRAAPHGSPGQGPDPLRRCCVLVGASSALAATEVGVTRRLDVAADVAVALDVVVIALDAARGGDPRRRHRPRSGSRDGDPRRRRRPRQALVTLDVGGVVVQQPLTVTVHVQARARCSDHSCLASLYVPACPRPDAGHCALHTSDPSVSRLTQWGHFRLTPPGCCRWQRAAPP